MTRDVFSLNLNKIERGFSAIEGVSHAQSREFRNNIPIYQHCEGETMNMKSLSRLFLGLMILIWINPNLASQQKHIRGAVGQSEEELRKTREKWLTKFPISEDSIELEVAKSFPSEKWIEKGIFLWEPLGLISLPNGTICINDQKAHQIFMFDEQGKFIKKIGREGQGPGEFGNPYTMTTTSESLLVGDNTHRRIQFFDLDGNYLRGIKIRNPLWAMEISQNGFIYVVPFRLSAESLLIDVINSQGHKVNSFGKLRFGDRSNWQISNMITISMNDNDELFMAFEYFPLVCRYSEKGKLLAEYRLNHDVMKEKEKINLTRFKDKSTRMGLKPVILSIRAETNRFCVLYSYPRAGILEYDMNGQLKKEYFYDYPHKGNPYFSDFIIKENKEGIFFYLLERSQEYKILILRPKKN